MRVYGLFDIVLFLPSDNDVAILKLGKPIQMSSCVKAIPLASSQKIFDGQSCITAGWGKLSCKSFFMNAYSYL